MQGKSLAQVVGERPFPEYANWWPMGQRFTSFMSEAITSQWLSLPHNDGDLATVQQYVSEYLTIVYSRQAARSLTDSFIRESRPIQSGEFDALSYAFFHSAFELIQRYSKEYAYPIDKTRRAFTKRVGRIFFQLLRDHLDLQLPDDLSDAQSFNQLQACIQKIGGFFKAEGYLRDHFNFSFSVEAIYSGQKITQTENDFLDDLHNNGIAFALYEMGYPAILPSAVYLYHTMGEAQHHSSRTIEELFASVGYYARESDDFDPISHPSDKVVELWTVRKRL
jgi:hypothetical protein